MYSARATCFSLKKISLYEINNNNNNNNNNKIGTIALDGPWPPRDEKHEDEIM